MYTEKVRRILHTIGKKADERGLESLTEEQKTVLLPWVAFGIIENGGFKYLYEGVHDILQIAAGFRVLGFEAVAQACERSLALLPEGRAPTTLDEAWDIAKRTDWEAAKELDRVVYRFTWEELLAAIGNYMVDHPKSFNLKL